MTIELAGIDAKTEVTSEEWEKMKREAEQAIETVHALGSDISYSAKHVLNNLVQGLALMTYPDTTPEQRPVGYNTALDALGYLNRYLKLLKDFPEFAEKELAPGEGYFPEAHDQLGASTEVVDTYETKLRGYKS